MMSESFQQEEPFQKNKDRPDEEDRRRAKGRRYVQTFYIEEAAERITEGNLKVICAREVHIIESERADFRLLFTIEIHIINFLSRRECLQAENIK